MSEAALALVPVSPEFFRCMWEICAGIAAETQGIHIERQATVLRNMLHKCTEKKREELFRQEIAGMTLLGVATSNGSVSVLAELLVANGGRTDNGGQLGTALHYLRQTRVQEKLKLLVGHGADVNAMSPCGETVLHILAYHACETAMKDCIAAGAKVDAPDQQGNPVLHLAIGIGNEDVAKVLLHAYAERNLPLSAKDSRGFSALQLAVHRRSVSMASLVLDAIVKRGLDAFDVDPDVPCPLATAATRGPFEIVKLLLQFTQPSSFRIKRAVECARKHKPEYWDWIVEHLTGALSGYIELVFPDTDGEASC